MVVGLLVVLAPAGCALRRPTVSRSHEAALGLGGMAHMLTDEEPRSGADRAVVWRASYARCLNKGTNTVCLEIPVDGIPVTGITSSNPTAPRSYSTLAVTPGLRFESNELPGGFLPINFMAFGLGATRYVSSDMRLDGTTTERQRTTTFAVRIDLGLTFPLRDRLGVRVGAFGAGSGESDWFQRLGVLPAGQTVYDGRFGGYVMLHFRR